MDRSAASLTMGYLRRASAASIRRSASNEATSAISLARPPARSPSMRLLSSRTSHYSKPMAYVESPEKTINLQFLPIRPTCSNPNPSQTRNSHSFSNVKVATDICNDDDGCSILRLRRFGFWLWRCGPPTDRTHQLRSPVSSSGDEEQTHLLRIFWLHENYSIPL